MAAEQGGQPNALDILRRNDPNRRTIVIELRMHSDEDLATALEQNNHISVLVLKFEGSRANADWSSLRRVIATRKKLRTIEFTCRLHSNSSHLRQKEALCRSFILAIQQNTCITGLFLVGQFSKSLVTAISTYIVNAPPAMKSIAFQSDTNDPENHQQLASALQRNSNITSLCLKVNDEFLLPILKSLSTRTIALERLMIAFSSVETPRGILEAILEAIAKMRATNYVRFGRIRVSGTVFPTLMDKIPTIQSRELRMHIVRSNATEIGNVKPDILAALKRNFNVRRVECTYSREGIPTLVPVFDRADKRRLAFFAERNRLLAQWTENPATVPQHLWPLALKLAQEAGRNSLYQSLRKVAPEFGSSRRTRKRKRPQIYEPSA